MSSARKTVADKMEELHDYIRDNCEYDEKGKGKNRILIASGIDRETAGRIRDAATTLDVYFQDIERW